MADCEHKKGTEEIFDVSYHRSDNDGQEVVIAIKAWVKRCIECGKELSRGETSERA